MARITLSCWNRSQLRCLSINGVTPQSFCLDRLTINLVNNLAFVETDWSEGAGRRDRIARLHRRDGYPIPLDQGRRRGVDKERPQKRRAEVAFDGRRPQLKTYPSCGWNPRRMCRREGMPRRKETAAGQGLDDQLGTSPSPQPSDLRDPQAGFAGARPSGKGEKSRGKRYWLPSWTMKP